MNRRRRIYEGKAKILYEGPEPGTLVQHFKDDATAFNNKKHDKIEGKGVLNNRISEYLFVKLGEIGVPTHFIKRLNMREQLIREVEIVPLEVVVRNVAAGSLSQRLGIEEPTLARLLGKLEQDRWIKRESAAHDRRCKTVHLQPKSSALLEEIQETARDLRHELIEAVSPRDLQVCLRVLTEIRNRAAGVSNATGPNGVHRKSRNGNRFK